MVGGNCGVDVGFEARGDSRVLPDLGRIQVAPARQRGYVTGCPRAELVTNGGGCRFTGSEDEIENLGATG